MAVTQLKGQRYDVQRTDGHAPGTVVERYPGIGLIGSERPWRGSGWAKTLTWWAAVNPSGLPGQAQERAEGFPSRRAAITWLLLRQNP